MGLAGELRVSQGRLYLTQHPVLVQKGPILGSCFHPELQEEHPLTARFADIVRAKQFSSHPATVTKP